MSKNIVLSQSQRNSLSENLALTFALPAGLIVAIVWFIVFYTSHTSIGLHGWPSIGAAALIDAIFITIIGFTLGYLRGRKSLKESDRLKLGRLKLIFDCAILVICYTIIATVLTAFVISIFSKAFVDVKMSVFAASLVVAVMATLTTYAVLSISVRLQSKDIINALTLFIIVGVFGSMITSPNRYWWEINFSSLGTTSTLSAYTFNVTLVLSGLLLLCLTDYLLHDLQYVLKGAKASIQKRSRVVKILFVCISLSLAGVGFFPWDIHPYLHTGSAYLLIIFFATMIISLRWLIPNLSKSFFANSYIILIALVVSFVLWQPFHYFDQTAFELIAFSLTFTWLVLFLRTINLMRNAILAKQA